MPLDYKLVDAIVKKLKLKNSAGCLHYDDGIYKPLKKKLINKVEDLGKFNCMTR